VEWRIKGGKLVLDVAIPANTTARVVFPVADGVTEKGEPIEEPSVDRAAGHYRFVMPWKK